MYSDVETAGHDGHCPLFDKFVRFFKCQVGQIVRVFNYFLFTKRTCNHNQNGKLLSFIK